MSTTVLVREAVVLVPLDGTPTAVVVEPLAGSGGETLIPGPSAYEVAVEDGFEGTEGEWLASLVGEQGETGPTGPQGAPGTIGPDGIVWRGVWAIGTVYAADDAVSHEGASYVAVSGSTGSEPAPDDSNPAWDLLAIGVEGPTGPQGVQGNVGPQGPTGPAGPNVNLAGLLDTAGLAAPSALAAVRRNAANDGWELYDPATQAELDTEKGRIAALEGVRSGKLVATRRETAAIAVLNGVDASLLSAAFTIPANAWATGEVAELDLLIRILNNSTANRAYTGTVTLGGQVIGRFTTSSFGTAATARPWSLRLIGHMHTANAQAWSCSCILASVTDGSASPHSTLSDDDTTLDLATALNLEVVVQSSGSSLAGTQTALLTYALAKRVRAV